MLHVAIVLSLLAAQQSEPANTLTSRIAANDMEAALVLAKEVCFASADEREEHARLALARIEGVDTEAATYVRVQIDRCRRERVGLDASGESDHRASSQSAQAKAQKVQQLESLKTALTLYGIGGGFVGVSIVTFIGVGLGVVAYACLIAIIRIATFSPGNDTPTLVAMAGAGGLIGAIELTVGLYLMGIGEDHLERAM